MPIWVSPLLGKELRLRTRERKAFWLPALVLAVVGLVFGLGYGVERYKTPSQVGSELFAALGVTFFLLVVLLVPALAAGSITSEKEQKTLPLLLVTGLRPLGIVTGKVHGAAAYVMLLVSLAAPFHLLAFFLGGVAWEQLAKYYVTLVLSCWLLAALGVRFSVFFRRSIYSTAANYALIGVVLVATVVVLALVDRLPPDYASAIANTAAFLNPFCVSNETQGRGGPLLWLLALGICFGLVYGAAAQLERRAATD